eukprot:3744790-Pyramimonas_sp.AAC.1
MSAATTPKEASYRTICIAIDDSHVSEHAFMWALDTYCSPSDRIVLVTTVVVPRPRPSLVSTPFVPLATTAPTSTVYDNDFSAARQHADGSLILRKYIDVAAASTKGEIDLLLCAVAADTSWCWDANSRLVVWIALANNTYTVRMSMAHRDEDETRIFSRRRAIIIIIIIRARRNDATATGGNHSVLLVPRANISTEVLTSPSAAGIGKVLVNFVDRTNPDVIIIGSRGLGAFRRNTLSGRRSLRPELSCKVCPTSHHSPDEGYRLLHYTPGQHTCAYNCTFLRRFTYVVATSPVYRHLIITVYTKLPW